MSHRRHVSFVTRACKRDKQRDGRRSRDMLFVVVWCVECMCNCVCLRAVRTTLFYQQTIIQLTLIFIHCMSICMIVAFPGHFYSRLCFTSTWDWILLLNKDDQKDQHFDMTNHENAEIKNCGRNTPIEHFLYNFFFGFNEMRKSNYSEMVMHTICVPRTSKLYCLQFA